MSSPPLLSLRGAAIGFGGEPLFSDVDLHLGRGERACLIGRNGCGKSTLMKLIVGALDLDAGERYAEPGLRIAYLAQEPTFPEGQTVADFVADGKHPDHLVEAILSRLDLDGARRLDSLSGGERRRAALAQVFTDPPDLLLLDEPTNHLDIATIQWLETTLAAYPGSALIISHDRAFLARVTNRIFWLDRGVMRTSNQGFATFDEWSEAVIEAEANEAARLDSKLADEKRWLLRGITARRKRNQGRLRRLEDMRAARATLLQDTGRIRAKIDDGEIRSRLVVEAKHIGKGYDTDIGRRELVSDFSTRILRGDRIGIIGPNGAGKTTLLSMLIGSLEPDHGSVRIGKALRISYFDQHRAVLKRDATLKSTLCESGGDTVVVMDRQRNVRAYLKDWLFDPKQAESPVSSLSGGERNRLLLAKMLTLPSDLLVLDEPTNDLDMETLDLLQDLLADFAGTLIVVSHDRDFLDRCVTSTIVLEGDGVVREYAGGYADYLLQRKASPKKPRMTADDKGAPKQAAPASERPRQRTQLSYKDQRELDGLPEKMAALEREMAALEAELADPALYGRDPARFDAAARRLDAARDELAASEERWLELEAEREALESVKAGAA